MGITLFGDCSNFQTRYRTSGRKRINSVNYGNSSKLRCDDGETKNVAQRTFFEKVDITLANLSILKTGKVKAIRFSNTWKPFAKC